MACYLKTPYSSEHAMAPSFLCNGSIGVVRAEPDELTALIEQALDLPEGMRMVQTNGGKSNWLTALVC
jgi:hypothetical protein